MAKKQGRKKILEVKNLQTHFSTDSGTVRAVDGVNFRAYEKETLAIVGESGSGKSITSLSIMGLVADNGRVVGGEVFYEDEDLLSFDESQMQKIRGKEISMIFQEPMTSLNPTFRVGYQIAEVLILHEKLTKEKAAQRAVQMLKLVGIPRAEEVAQNYPFELSGGMRQRVMIAMALACDPKLLIADEPTTALDVTIQAQILKLINDLKHQTKASIMLITHDLGVVAQMADYVVVMYSGKVMEDAPVDILFAHPTHPYTEGLLKSIPSLVKKGDKLYSIPGAVPNPLYLPEGCHFEPRCPYAIEKCKKEMPPLVAIADNHKVACWVKGGKINE